MRFVLSSGSLYTSGLEESFKEGADLGFDGIEVVVDAAETRNAAVLRVLASRYRIPVTSIHGPFRPVPGWQDFPVAVVKTLDLALAVQASLVVVHLPLLWRPRKLHWLLQARPTLEKIYPIRIGIENMGAIRLHGIRINRVNLFAGNSVAYLSTLRGLVFDTTHAGSLGWDIVETVGRMQDIIHVHLSDFDGDLHLPPGRGKLPLARFLQRLREKGFAGSIVLETNPELLGNEPRQVLEESLRYMRKAVV